MSEVGWRAFEAYSAAVEGRTHDGKPIPTWEVLSDTTRAGWVAVEVELNQLTANRLHVLDGLLNEAWGLIANAGWDAHRGQVDLDKSPGWHEAAIRWRDRYHALLATGDRSQNETEHLLSNPANAARLTESIASFEARERRMRAAWTRDIAATLRGTTEVPSEVRPGLVYAANLLDPPKVTVEVVADADPVDTPTETQWQVTERCACLGVAGCHCDPRPGG